MNILETLQKMKEACPVDCEVSISLHEKGIRMLWKFGQHGGTRHLSRIITEEALHDCAIDLIQYSITSAERKFEKEFDLPKPAKYTITYEVTPF